MFDVVVVGSLNLDLVATSRRIPSPGETVHGRDYREFAGGKGLNQAVAAARCGALVALLGAVGSDTAGDTLREVVVDEGIDDTRLQVLDDVATGRALIVVDDHAENSIVVVPGANAELTIDHGDLPIGRVVLAQLENPVDVVTQAFSTARGQRVRTVLNPAPALELPDELLALCDVIVPNQHEVELLGGSGSLRKRGVGTVVVTRGADGADVESATGSTHQDAFDVTAIDTTGAGDAFCGALAARLADGDDINMAVRFATAAGALATTSAGAVPSLPTRERVERLLARADSADDGAV